MPDHAPQSDHQQLAQPVTTGVLVARTKPVLDLSPRKARLIALAGAIGVVLVVVGSLSGNRPETIGVDKLLHVGGYTVLAALFVLALPPRRYLAALAGLAMLGALIELLQPLNARTLDPADWVANAVGLAIGAALGLGIRLAYGYLKGELVAARLVQLAGALGAQPHASLPQPPMTRPCSRPPIASLPTTTSTTKAPPSSLEPLGTCCLREGQTQRSQRVVRLRAIL